MKVIFDLNYVLGLLNSIGFRKVELVKFLSLYYLVAVLISIIESVIILFASGIFTNSVELINILMYKFHIDSNFNSPNELYKYLFLALFFQIGVKYSISIINGNADAHLRRALQATIFTKILASAWSSTSSIKVGEAVGVCTSEAFGVMKYLLALLVGTFSLLSAIIFFSISLYVDWKIVALISVVILPTILIFRIIIKRQSRSSFKSATLRNTFSADITDRINGLFQIKTEANPNFHIKKGLASQSKIFFEDIRISKLQAYINLCNPILFLCVIFLLYIFQQYYEADAQHNLSIFLGVAGLGAKMVAQINSSISALGNISRLSGSIEPVSVYLSLEPMIKKSVINASISKIELLDVAISLNSRAIFSGITCEIIRGKLFQIRGKSGVGKTTLANLIAGVHCDFVGKVYAYDDVGNQYSYKKYRPKVAYVPQDIYLFSGSIRDNLVGDKSISDEDIWDVIEKVGATEFIDELGGLDLHLDFNRKLSGGQKRRLGIARGLLMEAKIFILDEITAGLDSQSRDNIMQLVIDIATYNIVVAISHEDVFAKLKNIDVLDLY